MLIWTNQINSDTQIRFCLIVGCQRRYLTVMFAKVFGQIFDSSIAEDYNCRRMFMDLLVLADPTGAVDMTTEAIARRTNVPIEEVRKYIAELSSPDPASRSQVEQGKRLIPLDSNRDWGWQIVNYQHYRKLKDQDALRSYFRDAQRKHRAKQKGVKDSSLTKINTNGQSLTPSSTSSSKFSCTQKEAETFCVSLGLPKSDGEAMFLHWQEKGWAKVKDWKATIRKWRSFGYLPSQKQSKNGQKPTKPDYKRNYMAPANELSEADLAAQRKIVREASEQLKAEFNR